MNPITDMLQKARSVVLRRGVGPDDADDIVQEAFARMEAYTRAHVVRSQEAFLVNAAVNITRDQARRRSKAPFSAAPHNVDMVADGAPQPDEIVHAQERLRRAKAGLEQLEEGARRCLLAQRLDGMTYAEIAAREGLSVAAVEKRVARAVIFLVKWMDGW